MKRIKIFYILNENKILQKKKSVTIDKNYSYNLVVLMLVVIKINYYTIIR